MRCLVTAGKHVNNIRAIARQPPITTIEKLLETSTVTLRVVGGDEKGSLKSETVKYGREYQGTRT
jgi:hypothetical protein